MQRGEGRGEDYVAREKDPDEQGGEDVVEGGDGVETEEHVDVAGACGCAAAVETGALSWLLRWDRMGGCIACEDGFWCDDGCR